MGSPIKMIETAKPKEMHLGKKYNCKIYRHSNGNGIEVPYEVREHSERFWIVERKEGDNEYGYWFTLRWDTLVDMTVGPHAESIIREAVKRKIL